MEKKTQNGILQVLAEGLSLWELVKWDRLRLRTWRTRTVEKEKLKQTIPNFDMQELHWQSEQVSVWLPMYFPASDPGRQEQNPL